MLRFSEDDVHEAAQVSQLMPRGTYISMWLPQPKHLGGLVCTTARSSTTPLYRRSEAMAMHCCYSPPPQLPVLTQTKPRSCALLATGFGQSQLTLVMHK